MRYKEVIGETLGGLNQRNDLHQHSSDDNILSSSCLMSSTRTKNPITTNDNKLEEVAVDNSKSETGGETC